MPRILTCVSIVLSFTAWAEVPNRDDCLRTPGYACVSPAIIELYDTLRELPLEEQREQMWALPSETRAALWRHNLRRYMNDHPQLGQSQRAVLRDGIALVTTRGWFESLPNTPEYEAHQRALEEHKLRVKSTFDPLAIYEIFLRLGPEPQSDASPEAAALSSSDSDYVQAPGVRQMKPSLRPDKPIVPNVWRTCACSGWYECWYHGAECHDSYCDPVRHCGWYGGEVCWGNCKSG